MTWALSTGWPANHSLQATELQPAQVPRQARFCTAMFAHGSNRVQVLTVRAPFAPRNLTFAMIHRRSTLAASSKNPASKLNPHIWQFSCTPWRFASHSGHLRAIPPGSTPLRTFPTTILMSDPNGLGAGRTPALLAIRVCGPDTPFDPKRLSPRHKSILPASLDKKA
jgi:hypothetical protein